MDKLDWNSQFVYICVIIIVILAVYFIVISKFNKYKFEKIDEVGERYANYAEAKKLEEEGNLPYKVIITDDVDLNEIKVESTITKKKSNASIEDKGIKSTLEDTDDIDNYLKNITKK